MSDIITLKENREFRRAYSRGKSYVSPDLVTYIIKNNNNNLRIGITTGKKIGKAVVRNRCKRRLRELYRSYQRISRECADKYAKDAMEAVRWAEALENQEKGC